MTQREARRRRVSVAIHSITLIKISKSTKELTPALASAMANTLPDVSSTMSYLIESDPVLKTEPQVTNVMTAVPKNSLKVSCMRLVSLFHLTSSGNAGEIVDPARDAGDEDDHDDVPIVCL